MVASRFFYFIENFPLLQREFYDMIFGFHTYSDDKRTVTG